MIAARDLVGSHDIVFITLDSLRYDVAQAAWAAGELPTLSALLPVDGWELRHTPGSFTLPAHLAFLAGFLPTPARPSGPRRAPRLFAARFDGARGVQPETFVFDEPHLPAALAARGYRTICVGGVGFFTGRGALGSTLPELFEESHWSSATSVHNRDSARVLCDRVVTIVDEVPSGQRLFMLINVAATHTPTHLYVEGARRDSPVTQQAALADVDRHLPVLLDVLRRRGPTLLVVCADHGTCFGDDGYWGHGVAHPVVWNVPYLETVLS